MKLEEYKWIQHLEMRIEELEDAVDALLNALQTKTGEKRKEK